MTEVNVKMKIDVIGAGALGLLFGGALASVGEQVRFWTRTEQQSSLMMEQGIHLIKTEKEYVIPSDRFKAMPISKDFSQIVESGQEADVILIMTKQRHIDSHLLNKVSALLGIHTSVICFQNGIGHLNTIKEYLHAGTPLYAALTTEGAKRDNETTVVATGGGITQIGLSKNDSRNELLLNSMENSALEPPIDSLVKMLNLAGLSTLLSKEMDKELYKKLLINAVINPLTALWQINNGELLLNEERVLMMHRLYDEALAVYAANRIGLKDSSFEDIIQVCNNTANNVSSMLRDVQQQVPTEIDYINGHIVQLAHESGVAVPTHEAIWRLVRGLL